MLSPDAAGNEAMILVALVVGAIFVFAIPSFLRSKRSGKEGSSGSGNHSGHVRDDIGGDHVRDDNGDDEDGNSGGKRGRSRGKGGDTDDDNDADKRRRDRRRKSDDERRKREKEKEKDRERRHKERDRKKQRKKDEEDRKRRSKRDDAALHRGKGSDFEEALSGGGSGPDSNPDFPPPSGMSSGGTGHPRITRIKHAPGRDVNIISDEDTPWVFHSDAPPVTGSGTDVTLGGGGGGGDSPGPPPGGGGVAISGRPTAPVSPYLSSSDGSNYGFYPGGGPPPAPGGSRSGIWHNPIRYARGGFSADDDRPPFSPLPPGTPITPGMMRDVTLPPTTPGPGRFPGLDLDLDLDLEAGLGTGRGNDDGGGGVRAGAGLTPLFTPAPVHVGLVGVPDGPDPYAFTSAAPYKPRFAASELDIEAAAREAALEREREREISAPEPISTPAQLNSPTLNLGETDKPIDLQPRRLSELLGIPGLDETLGPGLDPGNPYAPTMFGDLQRGKPEQRSPIKVGGYGQYSPINLNPIEIQESGTRDKNDGRQGIRADEREPITLSPLKADMKEQPAAEKAREGALAREKEHVQHQKEKEKEKDRQNPWEEVKTKQPAVEPIDLPTSAGKVRFSDASNEAASPVKSKEAEGEKEKPKSKDSVKEIEGKEKEKAKGKDKEKAGQEVEAGKEKDTEKEKTVVSPVKKKVVTDDSQDESKRKQKEKEKEAKPKIKKMKKAKVKVYDRETGTVEEEEVLITASEEETKESEAGEKESSGKKKKKTKTKTGKPAKQNEKGVEEEEEEEEEEEIGKKKEKKKAKKSENVEEEDEEQEEKAAGEKKKKKKKKVKMAVSDAESDFEIEEGERKKNKDRNKDGKESTETRKSEPDGEKTGRKGERTANREKRRERDEEEFTEEDDEPIYESYRDKEGQRRVRRVDRRPKRLNNLGQREEDDEEYEYEPIGNGQQMRRRRARNGQSQQQTYLEEDEYDQQQYERGQRQQGQQQRQRQSQRQYQQQDSVPIREYVTGDSQEGLTLDDVRRDGQRVTQQILEEEIEQENPSLTAKERAKLAKLRLQVIAKEQEAAVRQQQALDKNKEEMEGEATGDAKDPETVKDKVSDKWGQYEYKSGKPQEDQVPPESEKKQDGNSEAPVELAPAGRRPKRPGQTAEDDEAQGEEELSQVKDTSEKPNIEAEEEKEEDEVTRKEKQERKEQEEAEAKKKAEEIRMERLRKLFPDRVTTTDQAGPLPGMPAYSVFFFPHHSGISTYWNVRADEVPHVAEELMKANRPKAPQARTLKALEDSRRIRQPMPMQLTEHGESAEDAESTEDVKAPITPGRAAAEAAQQRQEEFEQAEREEAKENTPGSTAEAQTQRPSDPSTSMAEIPRKPDQELHTDWEVSPVKSDSGHATAGGPHQTLQNETHQDVHATERPDMSQTHQAANSSEAQAKDTHAPESQRHETETRQPENPARAAGEAARQRQRRFDATERTRKEAETVRDITDARERHEGIQESDRGDAEEASEAMIRVGHAQRSGEERSVDVDVPVVRQEQGAPGSQRSRDKPTRQIDPSASSKGRSAQQAASIHDPKSHVELGPDRNREFVDVSELNEEEEKEYEKTGRLPSDYDERVNPGRSDRSDQEPRMTVQTSGMRSGEASERRKHRRQAALPSSDGSLTEVKSSTLERGRRDHDGDRYTEASQSMVASRRAGRERSERPTTKVLMEVEEPETPIEERRKSRGQHLLSESAANSDRNTEVQLTSRHAVPDSDDDIGAPGPEAQDPYGPRMRAPPGRSGVKGDNDASDEDEEANWARAEDNDLSQARHQLMALREGNELDQEERVGSTQPLRIRRQEGARLPKKPVKPSKRDVEGDKDPGSPTFSEADTDVEEDNGEINYVGKAENARKGEDSDGDEEDLAAMKAKQSDVIRRAVKENPGLAANLPKSRKALNTGKEGEHYASDNDASYDPDRQISGARRADRAPQRARKASKPAQSDSETEVEEIPRQFSPQAERLPRAVPIVDRPAVKELKQESEAPGPSKTGENSQRKTQSRERADGAAWDWPGNIDEQIERNEKLREGATEPEPLKIDSREAKELDAQGGDTEPPNQDKASQGGQKAPSDGVAEKARPQNGPDRATEPVSPLSRDPEAMVKTREAARARGEQVESPKVSPVTEEPTKNTQSANEQGENKDKTRSKNNKQFGHESRRKAEVKLAPEEKDQYERDKAERAEARKKAKADKKEERKAKKQAQYEGRRAQLMPTAEDERLEQKQQQGRGEQTDDTSKSDRKNKKSDKDVVLTPTSEEERVMNQKQQKMPVSDSEEVVLTSTEAEEKQQESKTKERQTNRKQKDQDGQQAKQDERERIFREQQSQAENKTKRTKPQKGDQAYENDDTLVQEELNKRSDKSAPDRRQKARKDDKSPASSKLPSASSNSVSIMPSALWHAGWDMLRNAPFWVFLSLGVVVLYVEVTRQLFAMLQLASGSTIGALAKRASGDMPLDLEVTNAWLSNIIKDKAIDPATFFVFISLWSMLGIPLIAVVIYVTLDKASSRHTSKPNPDAWWRNPAKTTGRIGSGIKSACRASTRVVMLERRLHGLPTFLGRATRWTAFRVLLFVCQITGTVIVLRQVMSLAYLVGIESNTTFSTFPDVKATQKGMAEVAASLNPMGLLAVVNFLLIIILLALASSWYALLHPRKKSLASSDNEKGGWKIPGGRRLLKWIAIVMILATFFIAILYFRSIASGSVDPKTSVADSNVLFLGANGMFIILLPAMGYVAYTLDKNWQRQYKSQVMGFVKRWNCFS
ncbi:hypothetical protein IAU59_005205 [Kwoniella sp. CBS 9459]